MRSQARVTENPGHCLTAGWPKRAPLVEMSQLRQSRSSTSSELVLRRLAMVRHFAEINSVPAAAGQLAQPGDEHLGGRITREQDAATVVVSAMASDAGGVGGGIVRLERLRASRCSAMVRSSFSPRSVSAACRSIDRSEFTSPTIRGHSAAARRAGRASGTAA